MKPLPGDNYVFAQHHVSPSLAHPSLPEPTPSHHKTNSPDQLTGVLCQIAEPFLKKTKQNKQTKKPTYLF
jgi:hypothetical protein